MVDMRKTIFYRSYCRGGSGGSQVSGWITTRVAASRPAGNTYYTTCVGLGVRAHFVALDEFFIYHEQSLLEFIIVEGLSVTDLT